MNRKLLYWVWITVLFNFSSSRITPIYRKFSPEEAYFATYDELVGAGILEDSADLLQDKTLDRANAIIDKCQKLGINIVTANSAHYPRTLERLPDKPYVLYVRGNIDCLKGKTASVVGTRHMTKKGEAFTREISQTLIDKGYILISGGADGIDSVSARVSLERGVPFVTVSAVDIDKFYPVSNKTLLNKIAQNGAVISEYPPDTGARYFHTRNRIIAGLSDEVYVTEAPVSSGALITAEYAKRIQVKVYTPNFDGVTFEGCRELIKKGALSLTNEKSEDTKKKKNKEKPNLSGTRLYIYERLLSKPLCEEELIDEDHPVADVLIALTELELDAIITALPGGKYKLR